MSFFQPLFPSKSSRAIDQTNLLAVVRDQAFQFIANILSALAIVVAVAVTIVVLSSQQLVINILIAWVLVAVIITITILRNLPHRFRVFSFSGVLLLAATYLLLSSGFATHGLMLMMGFVIIVTLFNGLTDGILSGLVALGAIFISGALVTTGSLTFPPILPATNPGFEWVIGGLSFLGLCAISIGTISITLSTLQKTVDLQENHIANLAEKKTELSEAVSNLENDIAQINRHLGLQSLVNQGFIEQKDTNRFLMEVVNLIESTFSLYHVGVYLLDSSGESIVLQAATGETGRILAEQKFKLRVGKNSIIGFVALNNEPRYAPDVAEDLSYYQNPMLPYTRSELSVPISLNNQLLGVLDLQADFTTPFNNFDLKLFQLLTAQLATLLSTNELTSRLDKIQQEGERTARTNILKSWKSHLQAARRNYSFQYRDQKLTTESVPDEYARSAMEVEKNVQQTITLENGSKQTVVALPIKLRGQVIGVLDLHFNSASVPQDLIQLLDATTNRLALALENARLLDELKTRADRERLVGDISARVRSSTAVQDILGAAAMELGRTLGVSEVIVQLRPDQE